MQKVFFHVGLPKTGTTALQYWLFSNRSRLEAQGFFYPEERAPSGVPKHQSIVRDLLGGECLSLPSLVGGCSERTLLLSTEGMTNHLYDFKPDDLKRFREALNGRPLTAFVVLREPRAWLRSYYVQAVLNPRVRIVDYYATGDTLGDFAKHPRIAALLNQPQLTADIASRLGAEVVVANYESDWVGHFCSTSGISLNRDGMTSVNQSPPRWSIELMRQFNAMGMRDSKRFAWQEAIQKLTHGTHTLLGVASARRLGETAEPGDLEHIRPGGEDEFILTQDHIDRLSGFLNAGAKAGIRA